MSDLIGARAFGKQVAICYGSKSRRKPWIRILQGEYYSAMNCWLIFDDSGHFFSIPSGLNRHPEFTDGSTYYVKGNT